MTEQEKLINVDLYGDGSRNSRLRAEYIYCDHADVCSVYKEGNASVKRHYLAFVVNLAA